MPTSLASILFSSRLARLISTQSSRFGRVSSGKLHHSSLRARTSSALSSSSSLGNSPLDSASPNRGSMSSLALACSSSPRYYIYIYIYIYIYYALTVRSLAHPNLASIPLRNFTSNRERYRVRIYWMAYKVLLGCGSTIISMNFSIKFANYYRREPLRQSFQLRLLLPPERIYCLQGQTDTVSQSVSASSSRLSKTRISSSESHL